VLVGLCCLPVLAGQVASMTGRGVAQGTLCPGVVRCGSGVCGLGYVYGTMMSGTGEWRARPTATEPTTRWVAWDELPAMIATFSSG
jgi:hypothetical protein